MSFLSDVKSQIIAQPYKNVCCRRAILYGFAVAKGRAKDQSIQISLENAECIEFLSSLVFEFYGKVPDIHSNPSGGRCKIVSFKSPSLEKHLNSLDNDVASPFIPKCKGCSSAFLAGAFLACGRATNPQKQYRIEFSPIKNIEKLQSVLLENGLDFSITHRRGEDILYTSNSVTAEDFFAEIGLNSTAFMLMNSKIEGQFKNEANRITNCETHNIMKTVSASHRWVNAIEALEAANLLSNLPEELEDTARMRLKYKDYSLSRLALEFTPPISKPGLSHRLNKIVELADALLNKKN